MALHVVRTQPQIDVTVHTRHINRQIAGSTQVPTQSHLDKCRHFMESTEKLIKELLAVISAEMGRMTPVIEMTQEKLH